MAHVHSKKPLFRAARLPLVLCPPCSIPLSGDDTRRTIKVALHTDSLIIARERRDAMMDADEHFWETTLAKKTSTQPEETPEMCRYRSARRRALAVQNYWVTQKSVLELLNNISWSGVFSALSFEILPEGQD